MIRHLRLDAKGFLTLLGCSFGSAMAAGALSAAAKISWNLTTNGYPLDSGSHNALGLAAWRRPLWPMDDLVISGRACGDSLLNEAIE